MEINTQIKNIRDCLKEVYKSQGKEAQNVFMGGNCGNFYSIIKSIIPDAEAYGISYPSFFGDGGLSHIYTFVDGKLYDFCNTYELSKFAGKLKKATPNDIEKLSNNYELNSKPNMSKSERSESRKAEFERMTADIKIVKDYCAEKRQDEIKLPPNIDTFASK